MLFNSLNYFLFLSAVFFLNYSLHYRFRWILLLSASILFYVLAGAGTFIVPVFITVSTYFFGRLTDQNHSRKRGKFYYLTGIGIDLLFLVFFKYVNFFIETALDGFKLFNHLIGKSQTAEANSFFIQIIVPLGISYITFQAIGYLIEIYRGSQNAEKNFGLFSTYLLFFPKLLSGPIERAHNFLPQLHERHEFNYEQVVQGLKRIGWGLFLKIVIANHLAKYTDCVFAQYDQVSGITLFIAAVFFTFQMYADFGGYTEIAIGSAQILGFRLMENFDNPFSAISVSKFWRRWHISLSSWVYDYIYNPILITYRNWNKWSIVFAAMVTFLILGFWHGPSWNYIVFGFLQGLILSVESFTMKIRNKIRKRISPRLNVFAGVSFTFLYFTFSLIFFNTKSIPTAVFIIKRIFGALPELWYKISNNLPVIDHIGISRTDSLLSLSIALIFAIILNFQNKYRFSDLIIRKPAIVRWTFYYALILLLFFLGVYEDRQFIYFQF